MQIDRYFGPKLRPFGRNSKPVTLKSQRHLEWISEQPCIVTEKVNSEYVKVDAHHVQLKSQGVNDYLTVPLEHTLHMQLHRQGLDYFQGHHLVEVKDALIAKLVERIIELEGQVGTKRNVRG